MINSRLKPYENWIVEATIEDIQEKYNNNELTSYDVVLLYLNRIATYDKIEKGVNSILELNPDALHIARALDQERKLKGPRSRMHGIPVVVKDNIDTHDKMHTSAGSLALEHSYAKKDSHVAKLLRESGAIILGKTNMTEWANFMGQSMRSGYSSRGGQVLNPYGLDKFDVGGSSSGTGAAIASNFATVGIGTETSGSILSPSSQNSLVGLKPTVGLVSRTGIIPISHSQDTAGPMTRTVRDAAILLQVISGIDLNDSATLINEEIVQDYVNALDVNSLKGARIGVLRDFFYYLNDEKKELLNKAIEALKNQGAEILDELAIPSLKEKWNIDVLLYEFKNDLNAYLSTLDASVKVRNLSDLIKFNDEHSEKMLKYGQAILTASDATSGTLTDAKYIESLESDIYFSREAGIDALMREHQLDAFIFPNNLGAAIPAKAGYPSITVPCGYTNEGEPVGLTFSSLAFTEAKLLSFAYAYEQATKHRKAPNL